MRDGVLAWLYGLRVDGTAIAEALPAPFHPPRNDTAFIPHVDEIKCNVLRPWLEKALADINVLLDGLAAIERQPVPVRRQTKLFAALNPENQTPIEV